MTTVFVPKEIRAGERRVAASPESVKKLIKAGLEVAIESGAGRQAGFSDDAYTSSGATLVTTSAAGYQAADIVFKVAPPEKGEAEQLRAGTYLFSLLDPYRNTELVQTLVARKVTVFAMELVPRTTRGQALDVLSSQASIAGYKAVLVGAERLGKIFPLLMTAAGTIQPAKVVVLGAGVAGLMALATAKRLGATVEVSDVRPAVKEQVESLGGRFIDLPQMPTAEGTGGYAKEVTKEFLEQQRAILKTRLAAADVVITTAQVPGKRAPVLLSRDMIEGMKPGAVVVDIAAAQGGNCELTRVDEEVEHQGVFILGPSNLPATVPADASLVYARNLLTLLLLVWKDKKLGIPETDQEVMGTLLARDGALVHPAFTAAGAPAVSVAS
ncbi:MAG: Re/Si-specific NAD(P)(+) transhydrogenase subunit alpha [Thermoanaerobaculia bacterium]|nr:Re/Si-specific NAD(P)(+) transhydrogenase subunit alpha [Thermoanaerobaculia bacterium]MBP9823129.1 Re/Si-specific NAD(P)(+) transhydrogenase subunit alpha [Thermoanaerobaculia bacterium]